MNLGERIKTLRVNANMTQKELADKLNTSFQTISKWEGNINEPDISTLKELSNIFSVSLDNLINGENEVVVPEVVEEHIEEVEEEIEDNSEEEVVEETTEETDSEIAEETPKSKFKSRIKYDKHLELDFDERKAFRWAIALGIISFVIALITCIANASTLEVWQIILIPIGISVVLFSDIVCIAGDTWITDVFLEIASFSIKAPGVIWTFDLDGILFLIGIKILFGIIGFFLGIIVFLFNIALCSIFSLFTIIPYLAKRTTKNIK